MAGHAKCGGPPDGRDEKNEKNELCVQNAEIASELISYLDREKVRGKGACIAELGLFSFPGRAFLVRQAP